MKPLKFLSFRMPQTLRWRLLSIILPFVLLSGTALFWLQYRLAKTEILAAIDKDIRALAERTSVNVDQLLSQRRDDLFTLSESSLIVDYYRNVDFQLTNEAESYRRELERFLLGFARRAGVYSRLSYFDADGRTVCGIESGRISKSRPARPPPFFEAIKSTPPGSWWVSSPEGPSPVLNYGKPVHDEQGRFKGALALGYDLSQIRDLLARVKVGRSGRALVLDAGGTVLLEGGSRPPGAGLLSADFPLFRMPWRIVVEAPLQEFLAPLRKVRDIGALAAVGAIAGLAGIILLTVRSATRPVAALVEAAGRISRGELGHRVSDPGDGELGVLLGAFNEMSQSLEDNRRATALLQSQLIQAEKLSAVGQLISSVAHELNNPLAAVCGYAQLALLQGPPPELAQDLDHVRQNALRCRKVVENLLFFVRRSRRERGRVDLNDAARSALQLLEYRLLKTEDVEVVSDLEPLPDVVGDLQQLVQVLVNLINNACDAMQAMGGRPEGKKISVRTRAAGGRVELFIEDNGPGIPDASRAGIFQPFFTTKEPGRGTGLGLSISRQIIQEHRGAISFITAAGKGTTFDISLPVPSEGELQALEAPAAPVERPAVPGRRVLVADDERDIVDIIARILREDGDHVDVSLQGQEALRLIRENAYDLVISDFEMEKVKGDELYAELARKQGPSGARMLFVTGDILNPRVLKFLHATKSEYLVKPFDLADLRQAARRLLQNP